jgi:hypothetical protein
MREVGCHGIGMKLARWTGLEPATPGVTGRYSNQLSYHRALRGGIDRLPGAVNGAFARITDPGPG